MGMVGMGGGGIMCAGRMQRAYVFIACCVGIIPSGRACCDRCHAPSQNFCRYRHGILRPNSGGRFLEHADGTPFYWLGDTHWSGFSTAEHWGDTDNTTFDGTGSMFKEMSDTLPIDAPITGPYALNCLCRAVADWLAMNCTLDCRRGYAGVTCELVRDTPSGRQRHLS